jgi:hypothetical protein
MIALDPNQTFEFTIDIEGGKLPGDRAVFVSRFMTARQMANIDALTDQAAAATARGGDPRESLVAAALIALAAVRSPAKVFDVEQAEFALDIDAAKPAGQQPLFCVVLMDEEATSRVEELVKLAATGAPQRRLDLYAEAFRVAKVSLKGRGDDLVGSLTFEEIGEVLDKAVRLSRIRRVTIETLGQLAADDLWDLITKQIRLSRLTEAERKKSALQSASAAARKSAGSAPAGA